MLREKLMREVAVPIWYGVSNLAKLSVSKEAIYTYAHILITAICFIIDCYDDTVTAVKWAAAELSSTEKDMPIETRFVDENLYFMPEHDSWEILGADVQQVVSYWRSKASQVLEMITFQDEVIDADFWREDSPLLLEGASTLLCLPAARGVVRSKPRKIKK